MSKFVPGHVLYIVSLVSAVWLHTCMGQSTLMCTWCLWCMCVMCGCRRMLRTTLKQMIWITTFGQNFIGGKLYINRASASNRILCQSCYRASAAHGACSVCCVVTGL